MDLDTEIGVITRHESVEISEQRWEETLTLLRAVVLALKEVPYVTTVLSWLDLHSSDLARLVFSERSALCRQTMEILSAVPPFIPLSGIGCVFLTAFSDACLTKLRATATFIRAAASAFLHSALSQHRPALAASVAALAADTSRSGDARSTALDILKEYIGCELVSGQPLPIGLVRTALRALGAADAGTRAAARALAAAAAVWGGAQDEMLAATGGGDLYQAAVAAVVPLPTCTKAETFVPRSPSLIIDHAIEQSFLAEPTMHLTNQINTDIGELLESDSVKDIAAGLRALVAAPTIDDALATAVAVRLPFFFEIPSLEALASALIPSLIASRGRPAIHLPSVLPRLLALVSDPAAHAQEALRAIAATTDFSSRAGTAFTDTLLATLPPCNPAADEHRAAALELLATVAAAAAAPDPATIGRITGAVVAAVAEARAAGATCACAQAAADALRTLGGARPLVVFSVISENGYKEQGALRELAGIANQLIASSPPVPAPATEPTLPTTPPPPPAHAAEVIFMGPDSSFIVHSPATPSTHLPPSAPPSAPSQPPLPPTLFARELLSSVALALARARPDDLPLLVPSAVAELGSRASEDEDGALLVAEALGVCASHLLTAAARGQAINVACTAASSEVPARHVAGSYVLERIAVTDPVEFAAATRPALLSPTPPPPPALLRAAARARARTPPLDNDNDSELVGAVVRVFRAGTARLRAAAGAWLAAGAELPGGLTAAERSLLGKLRAQRKI